jgi:ABC-2 type transport system ATP-binding protein
LPEERGLYKKESVLDVMVYFGRLKGLDKAHAKAWSREYLERVGLADKAATRLDKLSGGQQQKIQLGVTIMNDPELLILDEPTKGFDPVNRRLLMDIIEEQKLAGATVIMVTHQMEEVERLCDRVILLKDGTARAYGTVADVQEQFGGTVYRLTYTGHLPSSALYDIVSDTASDAELSPRTGGDEATVLRELIDNGVAVRSFTTARTSLDEVFIKIYGEQHELAEA